MLKMVIITFIEYEKDMYRISMKKQLTYFACIWEAGQGKATDNRIYVTLL